MQSRLDTVFWAYFDEYLKKDSSFSLRKLTIDNKQKINEVYEIAYFAIFQYKLWKNKPISTINPEYYNQFADYLTVNYENLFQQKNNSNIKLSKFNTKDEKDIQLIKEITTKLILVHINKTSWIEKNENYINNYYWLFSSLTSLSLRFQYDLNFKKENNIKYHSVVYPFLTTCVMIDIFDTKNMINKIKKIFSKENLAFAFKSGRSLSQEEKKWILPQLINIKKDEDWNLFLINFSKEKWELHDVNKRFKLIHDLSRLTTIFLKEEIYNISFIADGDEVYEKLENYLKLFLPISKEERSVIFKKDENENWQALFPINYKDYNFKWTLSHISKFKDYKKLKYKEDKLAEFIWRVRYIFDYIDFIMKNKSKNEVISTEMINFKYIGLVETLKMFEFNKNKYKVLIKPLTFSEINLDHKYFERAIQKSQRFEELADRALQITIMLRTITLLICIDYKAPKAFNYSISEIIIYYLLSFGPYKKNMNLFQSKDIEQIESKVAKLLIQYKKLKNKNLVLDTLGVINKLQNFS
ncbi:hypothetical protein EELLY_v1c00360 [Entomoplasma ellychniae]|uniref:Uncharacterized protein n=1 Tax=Entomoplasma ellychniae TaxID=2114 RepID=A0A8E2QVC2_9MOLU|nr:hypothetical protein [Entomoplasma ellychniae]PPE04362.1 hypothetical protein EELLY_v1c00360 [Entomoplasma ellychniae]